MNRSEDTFLRSPQLICHEKKDTQLVMGHFGNRRVYNTFNPELALAVLKAIKTPLTFPRLTQVLRKHPRISSKEIRAELQRLSASGFVLSFQSLAELKHFRANPVLSSFVPDQMALCRLTEVTRGTSVGILDFGSFSNELNGVLRDSGFEKVSTSSGTKTSRDLERWMESQHFFIVVGDVSQKLEFSRMNRLLLPRGKPWLLLTVDQFGGVMGPTFGIEGGPCYDCLIDHSKRHFETVYRDSDYTDLIENHGNPIADFSNPLMRRNVFSFAAIESIKILTKLARPQTYDGFYSFDFFNFRMGFQAVTPSPTCPICSGT